MVEPVSLTLGAFAVALSSKAAERAGEQAVEGIIVGGKAMVGRLRKLFADNEDASANKMLAKIEEGGAGQETLDVLAEIVDDAIADDEAGVLRNEIEAILAEADQAGYRRPTSLSQVVNTTVVGDRNTTVSGVQGSDITIQK